MPAPMSPGLTHGPVNREPRENVVVAVDVGGSGVRAARLTGGQLESPVEVSLTAECTRAQVQERIEAALRDAHDGHCDAVGFSFPAFLDGEGRVRDALNLPGLNGMDLAAVARSVTGAEHVAVLPDSAAAAVAEGLAGGGRGVGRVLTIIVGTGCNAGMTVDGRVVALGGGSLGDAGHGPVAFDDVECWCGGRGCLEAIFSGIAFDRRAQELGLGDCRALLEAARAGHAGAREAVERAGVALGTALATWSAVLWPERVVVGGGVGLGAGRLLLDVAAQQLRRVGARHLVGGIEIVPSTLGRGAPLLGAGLAAARAGVLV